MGVTGLTWQAETQLMRQYMEMQYCKVSADEFLPQIVVKDGTILPKKEILLI